MDRWREDLFKSLDVEPAQDADVVEQTFDAARRLGFDYCAYGVQATLPVSRPVKAMFNNYNPDWQAEYSRRGYIEVDPTVQYAYRASLPMIWSQRLFEATPDLWEGARAHGLCVGWAMPVRDTAGSVGLVTFARPAEAITCAELEQKEAEMVLTAQLLHCRLARHWLPRVVNQSDEVLTTREREVLLWTAEGKTSSEIGTILNLAERTANFHINNAIRKMGAVNKTQAVVKAALLGLLFL